MVPRRPALVLPPEVSRGEPRELLLARIAFEASWERDLRTGKVSWATGLAMFGYPRSEVVEDVSWWRERIHPDDRERVLQTFERALEGTPVWSAEYRFRRRDGTWAWVASRGMVERDAGGKPLRAVGAMIEVSRLKETEERLRLFT